ncbi:MAG: outer membrane protein [Acidobacteriota bacterium]
MRNALGLVFCAALLAMATTTAAAPPTGPEEDQGRRQRPQGFRFSPPRAWLGIRGGWTVARADSDIFDFNQENLTLHDSDFNAPTFGVDFGWTINRRLDVVFGVEYSSTSPRSEFRDFVDELGVPIVQQTRLQQAPLTVGLRLNLVPRGHSIGNFTWVPSRLVPYIGAGGGFTWWRYEQFGDFVDFVDLSIFTDRFATDGFAPTVHLFGGLDVSISPRISMSLEGRYAWADDELALAFVGFDPIDLAGFRGAVGINFHF